MTTGLIFEGVSTMRLIDQIARLRGWDPAVARPIQSELDRMCQLANHALERAWRFGWWPQLLLTRSVTYRPEWTEAATPYPLGEQVFWEGRYFECTAIDGTSEQPRIGSADWQPCERTMVCGISYERYGVEELDLSQGVYSLDPDRRADARALPATRCAFGCVVQQEPGRPFVAMPYIRFRPFAPRLSAAPWDADTAYPKGALVMGSDGESYEAWIDVPAGVNPTGESEESSSSSSSGGEDPTLYWAPRRCPRMFEDFVVQYAAAELQTDDNARGRGLQAAEAELKMLYNNLVRQVKQPGRAFTRVFR